MVHISLLATLTLAVASILAPTAMACEGKCKSSPTKFLYERYAPMIRSQLSTLPIETQHQVTPKINRVLKQLQGPNGIIGEVIFSKFHKNCKDKPPYRSPDEICGSAKSIACFASWDHGHSLFRDVHNEVVDTLKNSLKAERGNEQVQRALIQGINNACPGQCHDWVQPFQSLMLRWEQREHREAYGSRLPNCQKGRLAY